MIRRVIVSGNSMFPTILPGDRLLVVGRKVRAGDLAALRDPREPDRVMVKRVVAVEGTTGAVAVAGDNPDASTDSRHFGSVPRHLVVGRVRWRYWPQDRRGRLR
ncbi:MAG: Signal peptidase [Acidimicrobiales bacterium]|nr:Signal peptidase [Acidimicrobiales bacterium]